jgi:hypothetical protein
VLELLRKWYRPEWDMLTLLSTGETPSLKRWRRPTRAQCNICCRTAWLTSSRPGFGVPVLAKFLKGPTSANGRKADAATAPAPVGAVSALDLLAETGKARNMLELKLRRFVRRILKAKHGDSWIRVLLESVPEEQRKQLLGIDADTILNERLFLSTLIAVIEKNWTVSFDVLTKAEKEHQVGKAAVTVLLNYVNAHREDAHAKEVSPAEVAAVQTAVVALDAALDRHLDD